LDQAWRDTNADVIPVTAGVEQGGWIYMNLRTGQLTIVRKPNVLRAEPGAGQNQCGAFDISLSNPPAMSGSALVGIFHTHPSVPFTGASDADIQLGDQQGVPGIVRGRNSALDYTGTPKRTGTLTEASRYSGFPP
jgi:hypothetical protein